MELEILEVGTTVKCYDFYKRTDCYMKGTILEVDGYMYRISLEERVIEGKIVVDESEWFKTVVKGVDCMDDMWERIEIVN